VFVADFHQAAAQRFERVIASLLKLLFVHHWNSTMAI
jgi:hypothetical protein